ncbi:MAG: GTP-binding protein [Bryobacteraceae bacterium]|nr:GTP-binding protein [Bryobacteraceae bacterium]
MNPTVQPPNAIQKKVCMVGAFAVGKTSLVKRFVESIFDERYHTTIGVKIDRKYLTVKGRDVNLVLWDLAGDDELAQLRMSHLRGASGYILVADGSRPATLDKAIELQSRVESTLGSVPFVLALNKADLVHEWRIDAGAVAALERSGWTIFNTSAKVGSGVEHLFETLAAKMLEATEKQVSDAT